MDKIKAWVAGNSKQALFIAIVIVAIVASYIFGD